uniref:Eukaryotic translation initiation factor 3 subunit G N-terminal domain-containing protein n=1 Tax=Tanacetum cinerariifolium TaxID=118510 RepID=A0A6L2LBJ5_TANCI|nr:hypothetical protein [Tanacetum cinerariifolium]
MTRILTKELFTPFKDPKREFRSSKKLFKTLSLDEPRSPYFNLFFDLEENSEEEVTETMAKTMEEYMSKTQANYGSGIARLKSMTNITLNKKANRTTNKPSGSIKTWEDLKVKFLSKYCPPTKTAKKMEVILFYNGLEVSTKQILHSRGAIPTKTVVDEKVVAIQEMAEYSQKWHTGTSKTRSTETSDGLVAIQAHLYNLKREIKKVNEKVYAAQVGCKQCKGPHYIKDCPLKEEGKTLEEAYYTQFGVPFQQG